MKNLNRLIILGLSTVGLSILSSCLEMKLEKLEDAALVEFIKTGDVTGSSATGRAVFDTQVAPLISSARCVSCHNNTSPQIGQTDKGASYTAAKTVLNLSIPAQSRLIFKAGDGHCAPSCAILGSGVWSPAVIAWANAENIQDSGGSSSGNGLPAFITTVTTLDTTRNATVVNYPLVAKGADFTNVTFRVTITDPALNTPNLALITDVKLVNNSGKSILVSGIQIFQSVDATISPADPEDFNPATGSDFVNVSVVVPPMSTTSLSLGSAVLDKEESGGNIAFGFQKLQVTP